MAKTIFSANTPAKSAEVNDNFDGAYSGDYWEADVRGGWLEILHTLTYATSTTFTVSGDVTAEFAVGDKIRLVQSSTTKYFYVTARSYSAPNTTVTITGGSDYTLANAAITSPFRSHQANPIGFPHWFAYTPTWAGFSANPTGGIYTFRIVGRTVFQQFTPSAGGTSNATTKTIALVVKAATRTNAVWNGIPRSGDNGGGLVAGLWEFSTGATTASLYSSVGGAAWTASGTALIQGTLIYEI